MKRSTVIALVIGVSLCLCVVIAGIVGFMYLGSQVGEMVNQDPAKAQEAAEAITDFDMPEGYEAKMSMSFMGLYDMVMIMPSNELGTSNAIMLMQMKMDSGDPEEMQRQMERSMQQQTGNQNMEMTVVETYQRKVRGQDTTVTILDGKSKDTGSEIRQLITTFQGKAGMAIVMIMSEKDAWDQEMADAFLDSLR